MESNNFNIKSSTIEKGLEVARGFLRTLIKPSIEELGLLISDQVKYIRFKNQVKILLKAKKVVEKRQLTVKSIPVKILVPLLENASLEENEALQEKWSFMLANMVDSRLNFQNNIFPHILSQLSSQEFEELQELSTKEKNRKASLKKYTKEDSSGRKTLGQATAEKLTFTLNLEEFEIENIQRLGLIRSIPPKIDIEPFSLNPIKGVGGLNRKKLNVEYRTFDNQEYRITELGERFLEVCREDG
ncbi:MAG: DUF4393 domain-containing protein [Cyclobacteriaceae bacterium]